MSLALHANYEKTPSLASAIGATFSCTRAGRWWCCAGWGGTQYAVYPGEPRFDGFSKRIQGLADTDDLTTGSWALLNATIAKDANGPNGDANMAWTLTDDATVGNHYISQSDAVFQANWAVNAHGWVRVLYVNVTESTAAYITLGASADGGDGSKDVTVRLSDGVIVDGSEYYSNGGTGDWEGTRQFTDESGDVWLVILHSHWRHQVANGNYTIAFNNTGVTTTGDSYGGTGSTLVIANPAAWDAAYYTSFHYLLEPELPSVEPARGSHFLPKEAPTQMIMNSQMCGYRGKGTPPNGLFYGGNYGWFEGATATAEGDQVDISNELNAKISDDNHSFTSRVDGTWDEANAVRFHGTGQYTLEHQEYTDSLQLGSIQTFSIHVDAIGQHPTGPIIRVQMENSPTDDVYGYLADADDEGWVSVTYRNWRGQPQTVSFGLGVDGNDDTGDFQLSRPMRNPGKSKMRKYLPTAHGSWTGNQIGSASEPNAKDIASYLPYRRGLLIAPAKVNLILGPGDWLNAAWSFSNSVEFNANGYRCWDNQYSTPRTSTVGAAGYLIGDGTPGEVGCSITSNVTGMATSTRYSVEWYHWNNFGSEFSDREHWRWNNISHASQDLGIYCHAYSEFNFDDKEDAFSIHSVGTDFIDTEIKQGEYFYARLSGSFMSDSVATIAGVTAGTADGDGDNLTLATAAVWAGTGPYFMCLGGMPRYPNAWDTPAADIIKTTDVSWYDETGGTLFLDFGTHTDVVSGTFISINDGPIGTDRIQLVSDSNGVLRLQVTNTASLVADIAGPTLAYKSEYKAVVRFVDNNIEFWVNGVQYTPDTSATLPTGLTQCNLGSDYADANVMHGWIQRVAFWDESLDDEECLKLTLKEQHLEFIGSSRPKRAR